MRFTRQLFLIVLISISVLLAYNIFASQHPSLFQEQLTTNCVNDKIDIDKLPFTIATPDNTQATCLSGTSEAGHSYIYLELDGENIYIADKHSVHVGKGTYDFYPYKEDSDELRNFASTGVTLESELSSDLITSEGIRVGYYLGARHAGPPLPEDVNIGIVAIKTLVLADEGLVKLTVHKDIFDNSNPSLARIASKYSQDEGGSLVILNYSDIPDSEIIDNFFSSEDLINKHTSPIRNVLKKIILTQE